MFSVDEVDKRIDNRTLTSEGVINVISDVINLKFQDPIAASKYLPVFAKYYLFSRDSEIIKSLFYLCEEFKVYDDVTIQRYVSYTFFMVYYALPSYSKAIEYGLELEKIGFNYPFMKINTYKFMSIMCYSLNLFDNTIKYCQKCLETTASFFDSDTEIYHLMNIIYLNNLILINCRNKNYLSATINKDKLKNYLNLIETDAIAENVELYSKFAFFYYQLVFENKFDEQGYVDTMRYLMKGNNEFKLLEMPIDVHNELISRLSVDKYREDIIEICKFALESKKLIGDKTLIQLQLFSIYSSNLDDINHLRRNVKEYIESLDKYFQNMKFINQVISAENFRLFQLENRMFTVDDRASRDFLTNCYNRYVLEPDWDNIYSKSANGGTLVFIDIDNLKIVNDLFGHETGDAHIISIVSKIKENMKLSDRLYRYGGDEFILLTETNEDEMEKKLKQIVKELDEENNSSFSFGTVEFDSSSHLDDLLRISDKRMYENKNFRKYRG